MGKLLVILSQNFASRPEDKRLTTSTLVIALGIKAVCRYWYHVFESLNPLTFQMVIFAISAVHKNSRLDPLRVQSMTVRLPRYDKS